MSDAEKELKLKITADTGGLREVGKQGANAFEKIENAEKETIAPRREGRELLRDISEQFPIVGQVGRVAFLGVVGAVGLLVKVVGSAMDAISELGNRSTPAMGTLTEAVKSQENAWKDAELAALAYERALARITSSPTVGQRTKDRTQADQFNTNAETAAIEASQRKQNAILEASEKLGLITHEQYIMRKLALDDAYAKKRVEIEQEAERGKLKRMSEERANTAADADAAHGDVVADQAAVRAASGRERFTGKALTRDEQALEASRKKSEELEAEHLELKSKTEGLGRFNTLTPQVVLEAQKKQNEIEQENERNTQALLEKSIALKEKENFTAKDAEAAAREKLEADKSREMEDRKRVGQIDREFPGAVGQFNANSANSASAAQSDADVRRIGATAEALKNPTILKGVADILQSLHMNQEQMLKALSGATDNTRMQNQTITALSRVVEQQARDIKDNLGSIKMIRASGTGG